MELYPIEVKAIDELLRGESPESTILRSQALVASVSDRQLTSVGCFTDIAVPPGIAGVPRERMVFSSLNVEHPDFPEGGVGFVLFVQDGRLRVLEAFVYEGGMPDPAQIVPEACTFTHLA